MSGLVPADAVALGIGAFLGALSRYQVGKMAADVVATDPARFGKWSRWHTSGINVAGSFLLGAISATPTVDVSKVNGAAEFASRQQQQRLWGGISKPWETSFRGMSPRAKLMMGVGFCGSFTTFSTFSVDVVAMLNEGKTARAMSYVATNNIGGFLAAGVGMVLVKKFFG